jgi:NADP-dependent 3-hydroxy acid dehydrogenase YdfG
VSSEIFEAGGLSSPVMKKVIEAMPALKPEDVAHSVMFLLSTGYDVNISELTIKPVGEQN